MRGAVNTKPRGTTAHEVRHCNSDLKFESCEGAWGYVCGGLYFLGVWLRLRGVVGSVRAFAAGCSLPHEAQEAVF